MESFNNLDIEALRRNISDSEQVEIDDVEEYVDPTPGPDIDDYQLWPSGPYHSQVLSWKKQFESNNHNIYLTTFAGQDRFIWRTLARYEYKVLMATPGTDPLMREEMICSSCILWPSDYNYETMAPEKAGYPSVLAQQIMQLSGFVDIQPTRL